MATPIRESAHGLLIVAAMRRFSIQLDDDKLRRRTRDYLADVGEGMDRQQRKDLYYLYQAAISGDVHRAKRCYWHLKDAGLLDGDAAAQEDAS